MIQAQTLNEFVSWTDTTHNWDYKPLYLTEYGDFSNPCPFLVYTNPLPEVCGSEEDGYAFWGGYYQEGFWAVQHHTTQYLLSNQNQRWSAAWWFVLGWEREDAYKGGLYLNTNDPLLNFNGLHLYQSITCWLYGISCPLPPAWDD